jgi:acetoacetyl-[acyl-carrier protein] synthase
VQPGNTLGSSVHPSMTSKPEDHRVTHLPVIVGYGGISPAGRSSFAHAYRRLIFDALNATKKQATLASLGQLMQVAVDAPGAEEQILAGTLIRQLDPALLDPMAVPSNHAMQALGSAQIPTVFEVTTRHLPKAIPPQWQLEPLVNGNTRVTINGSQGLLVPSHRELKVHTAGQLPAGFEPGTLYNSRNHPRGLQMTVFGASDALGSLGIDWQLVCGAVSPDQISVYAGSGMGQLDAQGSGGMLSARFNGKRVSSKQCPLGFAEMPADFINAYLLGSLGTTGTSMGACASFLYNLRQAIADIQSGKSRVAIVGGSEAPILPDIIEGYSAMGALATEQGLRDLDGGKLDYRRACRPFGENCGFTLSESAQFIVLFDDALACELGAQIHGAATDVFVNADGFKKSISAPGVGNYLTMARALASGRSLLGQKALRERSFVQAHGTSTPQNRVTESAVLSSIAGEFGIEHWPVVAVKNFLGHSVGTAGADQLMATLGVWQEGILPGITNIDEPAADVQTRHLTISAEHKDVGADGTDLAIINAKGFGGNNASAVVVSPTVVEQMLRNKHGAAAWKNYQQKREQTLENANRYDQAMVSGTQSPVYLFDNNVMDGDALRFQNNQVFVPGFNKPVDLPVSSPYAKWLDNID